MMTTSGLDGATPDPENNELKLKIILTYTVCMVEQGQASVNALILK
jgi:hypothetical protein